MAGRDITEGRATRAIAVDVGVVSSDSIWQNTNEAYDVAIGGLPFFYAINDENPYLRQTAPYRKEQFDNSAEPGEQSLTGWWIRSQSSFHRGDGIVFYDPSAGESVDYRFADSKGVNVWTKGEVTMLKNSTPIGYSPDALAANGRSNQYFDTIEWTSSGTKFEGILYADNYILAKVDEAGTVTNFQTLDPAVDDQVYAVTNDGQTAFWITNVVSGGGSKLTMYKKSLNLTSATSATQMLQENGITVTNAVLEYTKERIVAAINNKVYEISPTTSSLSTAVYTHPSTNHVFSSITSSGPAIYVAGWNGLISTILKFTLSTAGVMPTLTSALTAAELPIGERVHKIKYYLGYMVIGTDKGIRVARISEEDGSVSYGPLIVETTQPVFDFAVRDRFVWCASGTTDGFSGLIRIDLSAEIEPLVFAYANDLYSPDEVTSQFPTTALGFLGDTNRLLWVNAANLGNTITNKELTDNVATLTTGTAHGYEPGDVVFVSGVDATFDGTPTITGFKVIIDVPTDTTFTYAATAANVASTAVSPAGAVLKGGTGYIESETDLIPSGYLTTGFIRYGTLEPKNFKRLIGRGDFSRGSLTLEIVDKNNVEYDLITYDSSVSSTEVTTNVPAGAQEYVGYKFLFSRDADDPTKGPIFKGYQAKATIATPRQRVLSFPVFNFDTETDRYNVQTGYEGRAQDRLLALETVEEDGDVLTWQDFTTGESRQVVIEQITFTRQTPPDKRFSGFGGVIRMTIRTV
jgi:hypothetical protein